MRYFKNNAMVYLLILVLVWAAGNIVSEGVTLASSVYEDPAEPPLTLVIDPGHGGEDGGAVSCTGVTESSLNLEIGVRLHDLLLFLGYRSQLTRESDTSLHDPSAQTVSEKKVSDLKNRVRMVQNTENAILVSIHQNYFSKEQYSGAQVFFAPTPGSLALAGTVQERLRSSLDPKNHREAKESLTVYLMKKITCPGILIECGFLSNRAEEEKLRSGAYQKQLVCVIACGLTEYLSQAGDANSRG